MGAGFKDFASGDILTAGDVDNYLMRQTVMTFADSSARDTALSGVLDEGMVAYLEDTDTVTVYDGSTWSAIGGGGGGGVILQVVTGTLDTTASTTSTSFVDTGLSVSITPSSATSKVAVFATPLIGKDTGSHSALITLLRDSTNLIVPDTPGSRSPAYSMYPGDISGTQYQMLPLSIAWLDSPATTSATTYKVQYRTSGGNVYINRTAADANSAVFARGVSSIIAMEVSA